MIMTGKLRPSRLRPLIDFIRGAGVAALIAASPVFSAGTALSADSIGSVTAVRNEVRVVHSGNTAALGVNNRDPVQFLDDYETMAGARLKLLFDDDSLLTLGEKTKLQINENIYDPAQNKRSAVMSILSGRIRVLVGKIFTGAGSKFEIHTPTAVAASRGTYYIVWLFDQSGKPATGVLTLDGAVDVSNIDPAVEGTVSLGPNQFTTVSEGSPPAEPAPVNQPLLNDLVSETELPDQSMEIIPADLLRPEPSLISGPEPALSVGFNPPSAPEEAGLPSTPPILQQPASETTKVSVQIEVP
jgi:hypothetical protein